jgi:hypothetical protein
MTVDPAESGGPWTHEQASHLKALGIIPWSLEECCSVLFENFELERYYELVRCRLEVAELFQVSMKPSFKQLRREGQPRKPLSTLTNDRTFLYLQWFLWDQGGITPSDGDQFLSRDQLSQYVLYSHGFMPLKQYPYIVSRPTAVILPEAGISDDNGLLLLDIYETDGEAQPQRLPTHCNGPYNCKDLMLLRLHVMQGATTVSFISMFFHTQKK